MKLWLSHCRKKRYTTWTLKRSQWRSCTDSALTSSANRQTLTSHQSSTVQGHWWMPYLDLDRSLSLNVHRVEKEFCVENAKQGIHWPCTLPWVCKSLGTSFSTNSIQAPRLNRLTSFCEFAGKVPIDSSPFIQSSIGILFFPMAFGWQACCSTGSRQSLRRARRENSLPLRCINCSDAHLKLPHPWKLGFRQNFPSSSQIG